MDRSFDKDPVLNVSRAPLFDWSLVVLAKATSNNLFVMRHVGVKGDEEHVEQSTNLIILSPLSPLAGLAEEAQ